jgi:2-polyprenyl-3-methyl-5-hydroxy-6-metoxy-1,4-benzoquinol methylase
VIKKLLNKLLTNPISFTKITFRKLFWDPYKYKAKNDYKAEEYWRDRFSRYGKSTKGPGDEGASEKDNLKRYQRVTSIFKEEIKKLIKDFEHIRVLEIGTGSGLITEAIFDLGFINYMGIDITDVLFSMLKERFKNYSFTKLDITTKDIIGKFDLIVIIDVIEHIVNSEKFEYAMTNLKNSLTEKGTIIIAPLVDKSFKSQFYERHWSINDIQKLFPGFYFAKPIVWEENFSYLIALNNFKQQQ